VIASCYCGKSNPFAVNQRVNRNEDVTNMTVKKDSDIAITRQDLYGTINEPTYAGVASIDRFI
jgi:hypothetical protein